MGTIYQSIEILSKEKGIEPKVILDAVKDAMLVAARKHFHTTEDLVAEFDEKTGAIQIYGVRKVVPEVVDADKEISLDAARRINPDAEMDTEVRFAKPTEALGRISAQTAKQVILQKVREAERENIFSEYSEKIFSRSASRTFCRITCFAVCAEIRPKASVGLAKRISVSIWASGSTLRAASREISLSLSRTSGTTFRTP